MSTRKCVNGHLYDSNIYGDCCPFCVSTGAYVVEPEPVRELLVVRPDTSAIYWECESGSVPPQFWRKHILSVSQCFNLRDKCRNAQVEFSIYNYDGLIKSGLHTCLIEQFDECLRQIRTVELYSCSGRENWYSIGGGRKVLRLYDRARNEYFDGYSLGYEAGTLQGDIWRLNAVLTGLVPDMQEYK